MSRWRALAPLTLLLLAAAYASIAAPRPPGWLVAADAWAAPSHAHWLGCGEAGVDLRTLLAAALLRATALAVVVSLCGFAVGVPLGALAAERGGLVLAFVRRGTDLLQAFPTFLFALVVLASVRTPNRMHLALVFSLTAWPSFARVAMVETAVLRNAAFVAAAHALGQTQLKIVWRHLLPNLLPLAAVQLGSTAAAVVLSETALAFVGFGPPDGVALGAVLDQGVVAMLRAPHVLVAAGLCVFLLTRSLLRAANAAHMPSHP